MITNYPENFSYIQNNISHFIGQTLESFHRQRIQVSMKEVKGQKKCDYLLKLIEPGLSIVVQFLSASMKSTFLSEEDADYSEMLTIKLRIWSMINKVGYGSAYSSQNRTNIIELLQMVQEIVESILAPFDSLNQDGQHEEVFAKYQQKKNNFNQIDEFSLNQNQQEENDKCQPYFLNQSKFRDEFYQEEENILNANFVVFTENFPLQQEQIIAEEDIISESNKKIKQKKKSSNEQIFPIQIFRKDSSKLVAEYLAELLEMKKKISKIKLFKSEKERFWFKKMSDEEIRKKIEQYNEIQFKLLKMEIQKFKVQIEERCFNEEENCRRHRKPVYYMCLNEYRKEQIYLCNSCILEIKSNSHRENREIVCKNHKQSIKYKEKSNQQKNQISSQIDEQIVQCKDTVQIFLCQKCYQGVSQYYKDNFGFISPCHFEIITEICSDSQCIIKNKFKLCPTCSISQIQNHSTISFSKNFLMNQFAFEQNDCIAKYEDFFIDIRQRLKLHPLKKMIDSYVMEIWHVIRFLESFAVHSSREQEKWIDCVLAKGQKEDMFVLWGIRELKRRKYNGEHKSCYLQVFDDLLQVELEKMNKKISDQLNAFQSKVKSMMKISQQEIEDNLNKKYQKIINIQSKDHLIIYPKDFHQISDTYRNRIKQITIKKLSQEVEDQRFANSEKTARRMFFNHEVSQKLKEYRVEEKNQKLIFDLLVKQEYFDQADLEKLELLQYKQLIEDLCTRLNAIQEEFYLKSKQRTPLHCILQQAFNSLKIIKIQYLEQHYSISAFNIFEIIHLNKGIKEMSILGVEVEEMQQFLKYYRVIKSNLPLTFSDDIKEVNKYFKYDNENRLYVLNLKNEEQVGWIKSFSPPQSLILSINTWLWFNLEESFVSQEIFDLSHFSNYFSKVSNITIGISFGYQRDLEKWQNHLWSLLREVKPFQQLMLRIWSIEGELLTVESVEKMVFPLFNQLSNFTSISKLQMRSFQFSKVISQENFIKMQKLLQLIFQNNSITHLTLDNCQHLPLFPIITTLSNIDLWNISFRKEHAFMSQLCRVNPSLKVIRNISIKQSQLATLTPISQLQTFDLRDSFWINEISLISILGANLRHLAIYNNINMNVSAECLRQIFPMLTQLSYLQLQNIDLKGQLLLSIASVHLKQLHLWYNSEMTNEGIQRVDCKWPYLRIVTLYRCNAMNGRIFSSCKFKGLIKLNINKKMLEECDYTLQYLGRNGIVVEILE